MRRSLIMPVGVVLLGLVCFCVGYACAQEAGPRTGTSPRSTTPAADAEVSKGYPSGAPEPQIALPADPGAEVLSVSVEAALGKAHYSLKADGTLAVTGERAGRATPRKTAALPAARVLEIVRTIVTPHTIEEPATTIQKEFSTLTCGDTDAACVYVVIDLQSYKRGGHQEALVHRAWSATYPSGRLIQRLPDIGVKQSYGALAKLLEQLRVEKAAMEGRKP